jgi:ferric-dicitrate binding protein FerR (iron transport regulator)
MSKRLIVSFLTGNCSEAEKQQMEQWLAFSAQNKIEFERMQQIYSKAGIPEEQNEFDTEKALLSVQHRIQLAEKFTQKRINRKRSFTYYTRIAAAVTIFMLAGFASIFIFRSSPKVESIALNTEHGQKQMVELPDGTKVYLNSESNLTYTSEFGNENREVTFNGEAFFEVAHNADKPFIVKTKHIGVEVLGTTFNFRAFEDNGDYRLDLKTGKVLFYSMQAESDEKLEQIILNPGERGTYSASTNSILKQKSINANYMSWHSGILEFSNCPLDEVVCTIETAYNVDIELDPKLASNKLTARFQNQKLDSIFETLQTIFNCKIEKEGETIRIR